MRRLGSVFLFGMVLLVIGASMAINFAIDFQIPLLQSVAALLLILWGSALVGESWRAVDRRKVVGEAWLGDRTFAPKGELAGDAKYDVLLGKSVIDLTAVKDPTEDVTVTVGTMFGSAVVKVDPSVAYDVEVNETLGTVHTPEGIATDPEGGYSVTTAHRPRLHLRLNTLFGSCRVVEVSASA